MLRARTCIVWTVAVLLSGLALPNSASAGVASVPLKAQLDLAQNVVVGKIVQIVKEGQEHEGQLVWGRATIAVSQVLKGKAPKLTDATIAMALGRELAGPRGMQSPPRVYRKGDEGVWVIMSSGKPSHGYGLLKKKRVDEIKRMLRELDRRVWSKPINGIRAWAGVELAGPAGRSLHRPRLMFAVQNVSEKTIYLPLPQQPGVATGLLRHSTGKQFKLRGRPEGTDRGHPLFCEALSPGAIRYMHPDGANYGFFRLPKDLPPGEYAATITLKNNEAEGRQPRTGDKRVKAWQGTVTSPSITFSQAGPRTSAQPEGATVMYAVSPADFLQGALMQARMVLLIIGIGTACGIGGILYKVARPDGNKWPVVALGLMGILAALLFGGLWWALDGDYLLGRGMPYRVIVLFALLPLLSGALALRLSVMRLAKRSACT